MRRKILLPLMALAGLIFAVLTIAQENESAQSPSSPSSAPISPFQSSVEGTGITEASTGDIAIGTPVSGIVTAIDVTRGQQVPVGAPLFTIDARDAQAQLLLSQAQVQQAEADLNKTVNLLKIGTDLAVGVSISKVDLANRRYDVAIKEAALAAAKATVQQVALEVARRTVRAPVAGRALQINVRVGEFAQSGVLTAPLMLFGDDRQIYLRVSIDEDDAWRVSPEAKAVAFLRGNPKLKTPLSFVRFDPFVIPKQSLTGSSTERPDVRVLQVIYSFPHAALPVYVGQEMDAFIEAVSASGDAAPVAAKSPKLVASSHSAGS